MKRPQRRIHLRVWLALAVVVPATIIAGLFAKGLTQGESRPTAAAEGR